MGEIVASRPVEWRWAMEAEPAAVDQEACETARARRAVRPVALSIPARGRERELRSIPASIGALTVESDLLHEGTDGRPTRRRRPRASRVPFTLSSASDRHVVGSEAPRAMPLVGNLVGAEGSSAVQSSHPMTHDLEVVRKPWRSRFVRVPDNVFITAMPSRRERAWSRCCRCRGAERGSDALSFPQGRGRSFNDQPDRTTSSNRCVLSVRCLSRTWSVLQSPGLSKVERSWSPVSH